MGVKCSSFLVGQPSVPVVPDRCASTWEGTVVGFHRLVSPGEPPGEYTKNSGEGSAIGKKRHFGTIN